MNKKKGPDSVRFDLRDQERLDELKKFKVNVSKVIKDAVSPYLDKNYERLKAEAIAELRKLISAPVS